MLLPALYVYEALCHHLNLSFPLTHSLKERVLEELKFRTIMMSEEMEKWRQQALLTSTAVMEAKNEVCFMRASVVLFH